MDVLRTCYTSVMKLDADPDGRLFNARWYFAPPGARFFPAPHRFGSINYSRQVPAESPFGELISGGTVWSNGQFPAGIYGSNYCGSVEQYQEGAAEASALIASRSDGEPACCDGTVPVVVPMPPVLLGGHPARLFSDGVVDRTVNQGSIGGVCPQDYQWGSFVIGATTYVLEWLSVGGAGCPSKLHDYTTNVDGTPVLWDPGTNTSWWRWPPANPLGRGGRIFKISWS